jgi:hypothetical protein
MADVVGLVASIIQIVQVTVQVANTVKEFCSDARGVPAVFHNIDVQLPPLISSLNTLRDEQHLGSLTQQARIDLQKLLDACSKQVALLDTLLVKIKPEREDGFFERGRKAMFFLQKQDKLKKIVKELDHFRLTLALYFIHSVHQHVVKPIQAPPAEMKQIHNIPPLRVNNFVPRVDLLAQLIATIDGAPLAPSQPKVVVVLGMGGQGKTQLVLEYCFMCQQAKPPSHQYIFWVDGSNVNSMMQSFSNLAKMIEPEHVFNDLDKAVQIVKQVLTDSANSWLMVFDNFDHPENCQDIFSFFPHSGHGVLLISSRNATMASLGQVISIPGMSSKEGLQLLLGANKTQLAEEEKITGEKILDILGNLPLAIDQAHAYIHARNLPLNEFLNHYELRKKHILQLTPNFSKYRKKLGDGQEEKVLSVFTTWEMSFEQLSAVAGSRFIKQFLLISAFFHPSHISENLFRMSIKDENEVLPCLTTFVTEGKLI